MRGQLLSAAGLVAIGACDHPAPEAEPAAVPTRVHCQAATTATLHDVRSLRGTVVAAPDRDAVVSPQVSGRVIRVPVREGDTVRAGQIIAEVESQPIADALTQARAALTQAESAARNASVYADRTQRLFGRGIAARQEADDAAARRAQADATVTAARAGMDVAARNLARATVRAPIAGTVLRVIRRAGELVDGTPATPLLEIADPSALEMVTSAPPVDLIALHAGQHAEVRFDALPGHAFPADVRAVAPAIDVATGMGTVRLGLTASDERPPFGLFGVAQIAVAERANAVVVPPGALRNTGAATEVITCEGGHAHVHAVEVGAREPAQVEITSGLHAGERVVIDAVLGLEDGAALDEQH